MRFAAANHGVSMLVREIMWGEGCSSGWGGCAAVGGVRSCGAS
jgi:hypothetical protein